MPAIYVTSPTFTTVESDGPDVVRWRMDQTLLGVDFSGWLPLVTFPGHE